MMNVDPMIDGTEATERDIANPHKFRSIDDDDDDDSFMTVPSKLFLLI